MRGLNLRKFWVAGLLFLFLYAPLHAQVDTGDGKDEREKSGPEYEQKDRRGDRFSNGSSDSPLLLDDPSNVQTDYELDTSNNFTIYERAGEDTYYRPPSKMTYEEYVEYKQRQDIKENWDEITADEDPFGEEHDSLKLRVPAYGLHKLFGSDYVEIKPNGNVILDFSGRWNRTWNDQIPYRQQRQGGFHFDQQISMNVIGMIGDKLKLSANWDTKASFEFQNNLKLEFTGYEEDIIKKIEAGNVSFPVNSSLFSGSQKLFGVKTQLQFGRLFVTSVFSSQRGDQDEIVLKGGSQTRRFEIRSDEFDYDRNFFLGHYFRDQYERSLATLPAISSEVKITRLVVYKTNRNSNTENTRNVVALTDLGEATRTYNPDYRPNPGQTTNIPTSNESNELYQRMRDAGYQPEAVTNLRQGSDYEIVNNARKLQESEYTFHPQLGYISLNTQLQEDEVLAVAYEYTVGNERYQVGQLPGTGGTDSLDQTLILKLLSPQTVKNDLPTWDLMMKNVYSLGANQLGRDNFRLRVVYKDDSTGADIPFLQEAEDKREGFLMSLVNLDNLNPNGDPPGDGNFDYIEGITVDSRYGRVIFPVLEPFGSDLEDGLREIGEADLISKYVFTELYDSTRSDIMRFASKNKFFLTGEYESAGGSGEVMLPGINIAEGSVVVMAGSRRLTEGTDYTINYSIGRLTITNKGVLESGNEIRIRFEKEDMFSFRQKTFMGTRLDYRISENFNIGSTILHQAETPQISRVSIGDEPSKNTIAGLDMNFSDDSRILTKAVDLLPVIQTKETSSVNFSGEVAGLFPGHSRAVNKGDEQFKGGVSYLDDFEGAETPYDLTRSPVRWKLGSTPSRMNDAQFTDLRYSYHRGRLAWYTIDNTFYTGNGQGVPDHIANDEDALKNHFVRQILPQEVFPNQDEYTLNVNEPSLDLAFYPGERGPYNYNPDLNEDGRLRDPESSWGSVTRPITNDIDFDNANIQYIEFWMMSPYIESGGGHARIEGEPFDMNNKGKLVFNLGSVSEDVMRDNKHAFEQGLPFGQNSDENKTEVNEWGQVTNDNFVTNAFSAEDNARVAQDVGLDGYRSVDEQAHFESSFINQLFGGISDQAKQEIMADPSADDFRHYLDESWDDQEASILERYKYYNGLENNSPVAEESSSRVRGSTQNPNNEDINEDNNVNTLEEYYFYEIDISRNDLKVGQNHIVDKNVVQDDATGDEVTWYQFRIPVRQPDGEVGEPNGYKSLRFLRMYMTGFRNPAILRFIQMQFVANQWRLYQGDDLNQSDLLDDDINNRRRDPKVVVSTVNIEENGTGDENATPYVEPPGFQRDQDVTSQVQRRLNEQSLQVCVEELYDGNLQAVFKDVSYDLMNYKRVNMFLHAHSSERLNKGDLVAVLRLGTDYVDNYYEIEVPLEMTWPVNPQVGSKDALKEEVWKASNKIDISIDELVQAKLSRNEEGGAMRVPYTYEGGERVINVKGNPDLSSVQAVMIGIKNPSGGGRNDPLSACIWANELLVSEFEEKPGYAATANMNMQLADLANITSSIRYTSVGFGSLDQKVSQRERVNTLEYGVGSNIALDKFIPGKHGIKLPLYVSHDKLRVTPQYDPLDRDVLLEKSVNSIRDDSARDLYRRIVIDETTSNSINLTNVRKVKVNPDAKKHFWDIENFAFSVGYNNRKRTNHNYQKLEEKNYKGGIAYSYTTNTNYWEPFKNSKWAGSPYLKWLKDFNINFLPNSITARVDLDRRLTESVYWFGDPQDNVTMDPFYEKTFLFNRDFGLNWNLTKNLSIDLTSGTRAIIDEPDELEPGTREYRQAVMDTVFNTWGRKKNYTQQIGVNYELPFSKLPFTDWISANARYSAGYNWVAGARNVQDSLGNIVSNNQDLDLTGRISMDRLYSKVKFLRNLNKPQPVRRRSPPGSKGEDGEDGEEKKKELKGLKAIARILTSLKSVNGSYNLSRGITLPGYMPGVDYFGVYEDNLEMLPFILGSQDPSIRHMAAENGWVSRAGRGMSPYSQNMNERISIRASIEPFRDFRIQVDGTRDRRWEYTEYFKYDDLTGQYVSNGPARIGSYEISYISLGSAFSGRANPDDQYSSSAFAQFEQNRSAIQERMSDTTFNLNSQQVLIPAFLAAYSGTDVNKVKLNNSPKIPLPNWKIDYTGLSRLKGLSDLFSSVTISHGYQSKYVISNFSSSSEYGSDIVRPRLGMENENTAVLKKNENGYYVPIDVIDEVVINERFAPLIGVNVRTKNRITARIEYVRDRTLALSMNNNQIQEISNNGIVFGFGYSKSGLKIPIPSGGNPYTILKNELTIRLDVSIRDGKTVQRRIEDGQTVTGGNVNWQFKPTINYIINQRLQLNMYFERSVNDPRIPSSYKRANTAFGIQLRFTLS